MKIFFSKNEYRQLLNLVFLGDWLVSAYSEDEKSPYKALRKKIYSHAKDFGFDDLIDHDKHEDNYYETTRFEEQVMDFIEAYNRHVRDDDDQEE